MSGTNEGGCCYQTVAHVGAVTRFRIHIHALQDARKEEREGSGREEEGTAGEEGVEERGEREESEGEREEEAEEEGDEEGKGREGAWRLGWEEEDAEYFSVTLRGPSIVSGSASQVGPGEPAPARAGLHVGGRRCSS
eukprot:1001461-Rhodomonas_salina.1